MNHTATQIKLDEILERLGSVVRPSSGSKWQWQARCPAHDDRNPSLSIRQEPNGKILLHCQAGCKIENVCKALGMNLTDLFPDEPKSRIVKAYDYHDESGRLLFQAVRFEPKDFRQRRPDNNGGWIYNLQGVKRVLYRLPELIRAPVGGHTFIAEGEKDVDGLVKLGLTATTCPMGSGKWRDDFNPYFKDRHVCILPDNDEPGREHADQVAKELVGTAAMIKVLELPGLAKGQDVSDWLNNGGDKIKLIELAEAEELYRPDDEPEASETQLSDAECSFELCLTERGNGERFALQHGEKVRFCHNWGRWLYYNGKRWTADAQNEITELSKKTIREIYKSAANANSEPERARIAKHAIKSETRGQIENMLWFAAREKPICCHANDFDNNLGVLNCKNGTIDLETGELKSHSAGDMITKMCPVKYDPQADQKEWLGFLYDVTQGNGPMMVFLQTAVGYSLTGDISEEKLFFIHGPAASGKSTFLEAVKATLGDYAQTTDFETFLQRSQVGGARNDIAQLAGARLVASIEVDEGKKLAEGLIKMLTGGDTVRARFLYQESFEFVPQFKLWLAANHAPRIKDTDAAMWRRVLKVPFEHAIPKEIQNPKIKSTLRNPARSGPAILAWAVEGCLNWQRNGLIVPPEIEQATDEYRQSQNPLKEFFDDCCEFNEYAVVSVAKLRAAYEEHARQTGLKFTLSPREFNERLRNRNCEDKNERYEGKVQKCWKGISLKTPEDNKVLPNVTMLPENP
ncbi:phage/plasmid primase, P4 family [Planctomycetota bacterium]